jgi:hypothetical protein
MRCYEDLKAHYNKVTAAPVEQGVLMQICGVIQIADKVFAETLFKQDPDLLDVWVNYPPHPLQEQEPLGDRKWIPSFELLQVSTSVTPCLGRAKYVHVTEEKGLWLLQ